MDALSKNYLRFLDVFRVATYAFEAGADIVTVLATAEDATIKNTIDVAKVFSKKIMVDMIAVKDIQKRAIEIDAFGADYICVHTAFDVQNTEKKPLDELLLLQKVIKNAKTAVAGGIKLKTAEATIKAQPEILVIGGAITSADDKKVAAQKFKILMTQA